MLVAGDPSVGLVLLTCLGGYLSAGGAGAVNHWYDRDIDARMARTADRPVRLGPRRARAPRWPSGCTLSALSFVLLSLTVNVLAASLAPAGFLGYVLVYTVWLKRRTPQNIVIGGAAGAVPPLVGWAAVEGSLSGTALYLFAIVFFWTPPHFWALSLLMKDEYAKVGVPMLPVVRGEAETRRQILLYTRPAVRHHAAAVLRRRLRRDLPRRLARARGAPSSAARVRAVPPRGPPQRPAPVPLLPGLPRGAVRRDGGRRPPLTRRITRHGPQPRPPATSAPALIVTAVMLLHVRHDVRRRGDLHLMTLERDRSPSRRRSRRRCRPPARRSTSPARACSRCCVAVGITIALVGVTTSLAGGRRRRLIIAGRRSSAGSPTRAARSASCRSTTPTTERAARGRSAAPPAAAAGTSQIEPSCRPAAHDVAHRQDAGRPRRRRTTTRWRKPPRTIATAASSSDQDGAAKTMSDGQVVADELGVGVLPAADGRRAGRAR